MIYEIIAHTVSDNIYSVEISSELYDINSKMMIFYSQLIVYSSGVTSNTYTQKQRYIDAFRNLLIKARLSLQDNENPPLREPKDFANPGFPQILEVY